MNALRLWTTIFAVVSLSSAATAQGIGDGAYGEHMFGWGWGHMIFGSVFMLLFWAAIIIGIVVVVRWIAGSGHTHSVAPQHDSALDILRQRFAKGEIDQEEFERRKRSLTQH